MTETSPKLIIPAKSVHHFQQSINDSVASYLMGFDPLRLIYLRVAANAGLGSNNLNELQLYTVHDGGLAPCGDVEALRVSPPFRVISGVMGEKPWDG